MNYKLSSGVKVGNRVNGQKVVKISGDYVTIKDGTTLEFGDGIVSWKIS